MTGSFRTHIVAAALVAASTAATADVVDLWSHLPLRFEPGPAAIYRARGAGFSLSLTPATATLRLAAKSEIEPTVLTMTLAGASKSARLEGIAKLAGLTNHYAGTDPEGWTTDTPGFARVRGRMSTPASTSSTTATSSASSTTSSSPPALSPRGSRWRKPVLYE